MGKNKVNMVNLNKHIPSNIIIKIQIKISLQIATAKSMKIIIITIIVNNSLKDIYLIVGSHDLNSRYE
jgi:hypothetical protein